MWTVRRCLLICSAQIQRLQKEVSGLKQDLMKKAPGGSTGRRSSAPSARQGAAPGDQQQHGYYYYPYPHSAQYPNAPRASWYPSDQYSGVYRGQHIPQDQVDGIPPAAYAVRATEHPAAPAAAVPSARMTPAVPFASGYDEVKASSAQYPPPHTDPFRGTYPADLNPTQPSVPRRYQYEHNTDDHRAPDRYTDLKKYYIPSRYPPSTPARSRSRRDTFERGRRNGFTEPSHRDTSPHRTAHRHGYPSPVRAHHPAQFTPAVYDAPAPPGYGSREHHTALYPGYSRDVPVSYHAGPVAGFTARTGGQTTDPQVQVPASHAAVPLLLQRSQSVPVASAEPHNRWVSSFVVGRTLSQIFLCHNIMVTFLQKM